MSSCLSGGGGRPYGLDLSIIKSSSISALSSSSPSSTLSESSNSPGRISTKRARTPRKRPNQAYSEAALLLSTVCPKVFSAKNLEKLCKHTRPYDSFTESSELLPSFPALGDAGLLIRDPPDEKPSFRIDPKPVLHSHSNACQSPPSSDFRQPGSPGPLDDDFDTKSILDEEIEEGIDSIMGNLSVNNKEEPINCNPQVSPLFRSLMGFGMGRKFELGFGFGLRGNLRRAMRRVDDGEWWRSPKVAVEDIVPKFKALPSPSAPEKKKKSSSKKKKKKKKKVDEEVEKELPISTAAAATTSPWENLRSGLLLKLSYEEVLKEWSDRGSPFSDAAAGGSPVSSTDILARLAEIELFPEAEAEAAGAGGERDASVMRYKEKRRSRFFSKKIRYQVRKVNADRRPRMKASGRFVKRPTLLQAAIEEGIQ